VRLRLLDPVVPLKGRIHGTNVPEILNQPTDGWSRELREDIRPGDIEHRTRASDERRRKYVVEKDGDTSSQPYRIRGCV